MPGTGGPLRLLTRGEILIATQVFGQSIQYDKVRVHGTRYIFFQPSDTAMTPNGEIYFPKEVYKEDFSLTTEDAGWILHELTHVWQYQHGVWVKALAPFSRNYHYGSLNKRPSFASFNIEQQAAIVEDYFRLTRSARQTNGSGSLDDYRAVIPFLPHSKPRNQHKGGKPSASHKDQLRNQHGPSKRG